MHHDPLYGLDFFAHESITVDNTSGGKSLTAATYGQARIAFISVEDAQIRFTVDGTAPTTTVGHIANSTDKFYLLSGNEITRFRAIRTGSTSGVVKVSYAR